MSPNVKMSLLTKHAIIEKQLTANRKEVTKDTETVIFLEVAFKLPQKTHEHDCTKNRMKFV